MSAIVAWRISICRFESEPISVDKTHVCCFDLRTVYFTVFITESLLFYWSQLTAKVAYIVFCYVLFTMNGPAWILNWKSRFNLFVSLYLYAFVYTDSVFLKMHKIFKGVFLAWRFTVWMKRLFFQYIVWTDFVYCLHFFAYRK